MRLGHAHTQAARMGPTALAMRVLSLAKYFLKAFSKESKFPLLRAGFPYGDQTLKLIQPLVTWAEGWQAIPGVPDWVLGIIERDYRLQYVQRPPRFSGMVSTSVQNEDAHVLRTEVMNLLAKGAIETVPPAK